MKVVIYRKNRTPVIFLGVIKGLKELYFDESGAVATEYVIITGLLAIALIGAANALAEATRLWFWQKALRIIKY